MYSKNDKVVTQNGETAVVRWSDAVSTSIELAVPTTAYADESGEAVSYVIVATASLRLVESGNTFERILKDRLNANNYSAVKDALELARAFVASNGDRDSLYACLRLLDSMARREGGYLASYLDGSYFTDCGGDSLAAALNEHNVSERWSRIEIEEYRDEAFAFIASQESK